MYTVSYHVSNLGRLRGCSGDPYLQFQPFLEVHNLEWDTDDKQVKIKGQHYKLHCEGKKIKTNAKIEKTVQTLMFLACVGRTSKRYCLNGAPKDKTAGYVKDRGRTWRARQGKQHKQRSWAWENLTSCRIEGRPVWLGHSSCHRSSKKEAWRRREDQEHR